MNLRLCAILVVVLTGTALLAQDEPISGRKRHYVPRYPLEIGFSIGSSHFLGDLGGTGGLGQALWVDNDWESVRPMVGGYIRYNIGGHFSLRLNLNYVYLYGNDQYTGQGFDATQWAPDEAGWFRYYRNLHFRSLCLEICQVGHYTPFNLKLSGSLYTEQTDYRLAPYILAGVGLLCFNPQARLGGTWVDLHPLRTEGQGLVDGRPEYRLMQFIVPVGIGVQWEHNHSYVFSLEVRHQITFTDYLDDVSTDYVSPSVFTDYHDPATAAQATTLARRSAEQDPKERYGYITAPGQQRGNASNNDSYFLISLRLGFYLKRSRKLAIVKDYVGGRL
mgnify:CR=1 FL=1